MKSTLYTIATAAALLAGCLGGATPATDDTTAASAARGGATVLPAGDLGGGLVGNATAPLALHLHADGTMQEAPAEAGYVALQMAANGPQNEEPYPTWTGVLPRSVNVTSAGVEVAFYVSTNTASFAARSVPPFMVLEPDWDGMLVRLRVGAKVLEGVAHGPDRMVAGEIYLANATVTGALGPVAAGESIELTEIVFYTHAKGAAEFRFVVGPEHAAGVFFR